MSEQETAAKPAKKSGKPAVVWTVRIVVFGVLAALLVVAILEFRAKKQMGDSLAAIGEKLEPVNSQLSVEEAEQLLVGSPESAMAKDVGGRKRKIYTWSGPLSRIRTYKIALIYREVGTRTIVDKASPDAEDTE